MTASPLTPLSYRQDGKYRFELTDDFEVNVPSFAGRAHSVTGFGSNTPGAVGVGSFEAWLQIDQNGVLTLSQGYAWDGCSPAWKFAGKWWGTPTPEATRAACLVHDALYQFLDRNYWTRAEADAAFLALMQQSGFRLAPIYYGAVRIFGGLHHLLFR